MNGVARFRAFLNHDHTAGLLNHVERVVIAWRAERQHGCAESLSVDDVDGSESRRHHAWRCALIVGVLVVGVLVVGVLVVGVLVVGVLCLAVGDTAVHDVSVSDIAVGDAGVGGERVHCAGVRR